MSDRFAEDLSRKIVIRSDGTELGMLDTISMSVTTGVLSTLLVEPTKTVVVDPDVPVNEDGWVVSSCSDLMRFVGNATSAFEMLTTPEQSRC